MFVERDVPLAVSKTRYWKDGVCDFEGEMLVVENVTVLVLHYHHQHRHHDHRHHHSCHQHHLRYHLRCHLRYHPLRPDHLSSPRTIVRSSW